MKFKKLLKLTTAALLASVLTGCIGAVVGVAVDTTVAVVKAPFQIAGAVVGAAADTTGTVIAAPFRAVDAAFGGDHKHQDYHQEHGHGGAEEATGEEIKSHRHNHDSHEHFREHKDPES
jgi:hypothetical protein